MVESYLQQAMRCRTVNEFNRLHITLENVLAPAEIAGIIAGVRQRVTSMPEPVSHWLSHWESWLARVGGPPQPYAREGLTGSAVRYAAPGDAAARANRTLVIGFTGDAHRMMMPIALFLQHCPADRFEFVVLFDRRRMHYLRGIEGLGDDIPSIIESIRPMAAHLPYRRTMTFGSSSGGLASVWAGIALGVSRVVSVGGTSPSFLSERLTPEELGENSFEAFLRSHRGPLPHIVLVSGEHHARDNEKALEMAAYVPTTHIRVPGSTSHNMLYDAWNQGQLAPLLGRLMGEEPPTA